VSSAVGAAAALQWCPTLTALLLEKARAVVAVRWSQHLALVWAQDRHNTFAQPAGAGRAVCLCYHPPGWWEARLLLAFLTLVGRGQRSGDT